VLHTCTVLELLPFPTTYLAKLNSGNVATKSKYRYRINAAPDMFIQLSSLTPRHHSSSH